MREPEKRKTPKKVYPDLDSNIRKMRPQGNYMLYLMFHEASIGDMSAPYGSGFKKMVGPFTFLWCGEPSEIVDNAKLAVVFKTLSEWTADKEVSRYLVEVLVLLQMSWEAYSGVTSDRFPSKAPKMACSTVDRDQVLGVIR